MAIVPPTEDDNDYDWLLSHTAEVHALAHGLYDGVVVPTPNPDHAPPSHPDVRAEVHYYKAGYVIGTLLERYTRPDKD